MCVAVQTVPGTCANLVACSAQIKVSLPAHPIHSLADSRRKAMSLGTILLILLIVLLVGAVPACIEGMTKYSGIVDFHAIKST